MKLPEPSQVTITTTGVQASFGHPVQVPEGAEPDAFRDLTLLAAMNWAIVRITAECASLRQAIEDRNASGTIH